MLIKILIGICICVSGVLSTNRLGQEQLDCQAPWEQVGDMCILLHTGFRSWDRARLYCKVFKSDLLYFNEEQEAKQVEAFLSLLMPQRAGHALIWLDATNKYDNVNWVWSKNNRTIGYNKWHPVLHNEVTAKLRNAHCAGMMLEDFTWKEANCEDTAQFICRRDIGSTRQVTVHTQLPIVTGRFVVPGTNIELNQNELNDIVQQLATIKPEVQAVHQPAQHVSRIENSRLIQENMNNNMIASGSDLNQNGTEYEEVVLNNEDEMKSVLDTLLNTQHPTAAPVLPVSTTVKMHFLHHDTRVNDELLDDGFNANGQQLFHYDDHEVLSMGHESTTTTVAAPRVAATNPIDEDEHIIRVVQNPTLLDVLSKVNLTGQPIVHVVHETWRVGNGQPIVVESNTVDSDLPESVKEMLAEETTPTVRPEPDQYNVELNDLIDEASVKLEQTETPLMETQPLIGTNDDHSSDFVEGMHPEEHVGHHEEFQGIHLDAPTESPMDSLMHKVDRLEDDMSALVDFQLAHTTTLEPEQYEPVQFEEPTEVQVQETLPPVVAPVVNNHQQMNHPRNFHSYKLHGEDENASSHVSASSTVLILLALHAFLQYLF